MTSPSLLRPAGARLRSATAALLAPVLLAVVTTATAGTASAAPAARAATLPTTQVVAEAATGAGVDHMSAWRTCVAMRTLLLPAARSGRIYDVGLDTGTEVRGDAQVHTCRVRFLGRPTAQALAKGVAAVAAAHPTWTVRTAPDAVHGVLYSVRLRRVTSHGMNSALLRVADQVAPGPGACGGGDVDRLAVLRVVSFDPIPSDRVARGQEGVARATGAPARTVVRRSPWTAPASTVCADARHDSFTTIS